MNAQTLASLFYTAENGNLCITDGAPDAEAVRDMVRAADESGLGWDFAYEAVRDALLYVADTQEDPAESDTASMFADGAVDPYTADLVRWLAAAPLKHLALCDEANEEMPADASAGLEDRLRFGQYHAYELAMNAVGNRWEPDEDTAEEDDTDA